jgi:hypothetical protein
MDKTENTLLSIIFAVRIRREILHYLSFKNKLHSRADIERHNRRERERERERERKSERRGG